MKKRLLSLLLTLAMVVSLFAGMSVTASAAENTIQPFTGVTFEGTRVTLTLDSSKTYVLQKKEIYDYLDQDYVQRLLTGGTAMVGQPVLTSSTEIQNNFYYGSIKTYVDIWNNDFDSMTVSNQNSYTIELEEKTLLRVFEINPDIYYNDDYYPALAAYAAILTPVYPPINSVDLTLNWNGMPPMVDGGEFPFFMGELYWPVVSENQNVWPWTAMAVKVTVDNVKNVLDSEFIAMLDEESTMSNADLLAAYKEFVVEEGYTAHPDWVMFWDEGDVLVINPDYRVNSTDEYALVINVVTERGSFPENVAVTLDEVDVNVHRYVFEDTCVRVSFVYELGTLDEFEDNLPAPPVRYAVTKAECENGSLTVTQTDALVGDYIWIETRSNDGYVLESVKVYKTEDDTLVYTVEIDRWGEGVFSMPAYDVTVKATFVPVSYSVAVNSAEHGTVTSSHETAAAGTTVTLTATPDTGYKLDSLTVKDQYNNPVTVTNNQFTMPARDVTVTAEFIADEEPGEGGGDPISVSGIHAGDLIPVGTVIRLEPNSDVFVDDYTSYLWEMSAKAYYAEICDKLGITGYGNFFTTNSNKTANLTMSNSFDATKGSGTIETTKAWLCYKADGDWYFVSPDELGGSNSALKFAHDSYSVSQGASVTLEADFADGTAPTDESEVVYSLVGTYANGTSVNAATGLLTVAADETATTITVQSSVNANGMLFVTNIDVAVNGEDSDEPDDGGGDVTPELGNIANLGDTCITVDGNMVTVNENAESYDEEATYILSALPVSLVSLTGKTVEQYIKFVLLPVGESIVDVTALDLTSYATVWPYAEAQTVLVLNQKWTEIPAELTEDSVVVVYKIYDTNMNHHDFGSGAENPYFDSQLMVGIDGKVYAYGVHGVYAALVEGPEGGEGDVNMVDTIELQINTDKLVGIEEIADYDFRQPTDAFIFDSEFGSEIFGDWYGLWMYFDEEAEEWFEIDDAEDLEKLEDDTPVALYVEAELDDGYQFTEDATGAYGDLVLMADWFGMDYVEMAFDFGTKADVDELLGDDPDEPETPPAPPVIPPVIPVTPPTVDVPVSNDEVSVDVSATVSGNDATIKPLNDKQIEQLVGSDNASGDVVIDLTELGKKIDTAGIPKASLEAIVEAAEDAGNDTEHLVIKLSTATLTIDDAALRAIVDQAKGDIIKFNFDDVGTTRLNTAQKNAVKDLDVRKGYEAYITVNGQRVSDFNGGEVEIIVPYVVPEGENIAGFSVWYIGEDGKPEKQKSTYDGKEKCFVVTHFSDYVIAYSEEDAQAGSCRVCPKDETCPIHPYSDTSTTAWYHDGVHYCIEKGLMKGIGEAEFAPGMITSRAMIATILWRMEGAPVADYAMTFKDVAEGKWYTEAIRWAQSVGVVEGYNADTFGPNNTITREQMATILWRYCKYKNIDVSVGEDTNILSFADAADVSGWAMEAMQWACGSGMIQGIEKDGVMYLDPQGDAVRSQSATMIYRFCVEIMK